MISSFWVPQSGLAVLVAAFSCMATPCFAQQASLPANASRGAPATDKSGYLGVQVTELSPELRRFFGSPKEMGILVSKIDRGSPADKGGLKVGDVIEKLDGEKVVSVWVLGRIVTGKNARDVLVVEVRRNHKPRVMKVTIEERARPQIDVAELFQWQGPQNGRIEFQLVDPQAFMRAAESFKNQFREPMILTRMQEMRRLLKREKTLELRIMQLEARIMQLEVQLRDD